MNLTHKYTRLADSTSESESLAVMQQVATPNSIATKPNSLTVDNLQQIAELPPELDPFVEGLSVYIQQLDYVLHQIQVVRASEKSIKARLASCKKLHAKLLGEEPTFTAPTPTEAGNQAATVRGTLDVLTNLRDIEDFQ